MAEPSNDFLAAAQSGTGVDVKTFASISAALSSAETNDGLLILADNITPANPGHPNANATIAVTAVEWEVIQIAITP